MPAFDPVHRHFCLIETYPAVRYVRIIQIDPDVFPRMAFERLVNCAASA